MLAVREQSDGMVNSLEILKAFRALGCEDEALCYAAYRVYVHLTEEKHLHDVQYHYAAQLRGIYLTARRDPAAPHELFIPALATGELRFSELDAYRSTVALPNGEPVERCVLAICDPSSTVLLYKVTPGLKSIDEKLPSRGQLMRQKANAVNAVKKGPVNRRSK